MNFTDLFLVIAGASALYGLIVAVTRQRHFLVRAVNPNRGTWLIAALVILWVGISLLRLEAESWDLEVWGGLLGQLVTHESTPPRVKVASMAIFLGLTFLILVAWCCLCLPWDPSIFCHPQDRKAAFRYYVTRLKGGLDYALLACGDGERLEEATNLRQIQRYCPHMPKVQVDQGEPHFRTPEEQIDFWRRQCAQIHQRMGELDRLIAPAHQGHNRRLVFDVEYGGFFFKYLRLSDPNQKVDTALYLFGATLNQVEMDTRAVEHFRLLLEALQHIDRSIRVN